MGQKSKEEFSIFSEDDGDKVLGLGRFLDDSIESFEGMFVEDTEIGFEVCLFLKNDFLCAAYPKEQFLDYIEKLKGKFK